MSLDDRRLRQELDLRDEPVPFAERPVRVKSPCVNVCMMNDETGYCVGCKRTLDEIARWGSATDAERLAILAQLEDRDVFGA